MARKTLSEACRTIPNLFRHQSCCFHVSTSVFIFRKSYCMQLQCSQFQWTGVCFNPSFRQKVPVITAVCVGQSVLYSRSVRAPNCQPVGGIGAVVTTGQCEVTREALITHTIPGGNSSIRNLVNFINKINRATSGSWEPVHELL